MSRKNRKSAHPAIANVAQPEVQQEVQQEPQVQQEVQQDAGTVLVQTGQGEVPALDEPSIPGETEEQRVARICADGKKFPGMPSVMLPNNLTLGAAMKEARIQWAASGANITKKQCVLEMMLDEKGCRVSDIVEALGVTPTAARSLIGDVRRMKETYVISQAGGVYTATERRVVQTDSGDQELNEALNEMEEAAQ